MYAFVLPKGTTLRSSFPQNWYLDKINSLAMDIYLLDKNKNLVLQIHSSELSVTIWLMRFIQMWQRIRSPVHRSWQGFRCIPASECWHKSLTPLMEEVRQQMGGGPVYLTFDIDSLDPAFAPGTGKWSLNTVKDVQTPWYSSI